MLIKPRRQALLRAQPFEPILSRRGLLGLGTAAAAVGILGGTGLAKATTRQPSINPTAAPYNADPSGRTDSTAAFQAVLDAIEAAGGGVLQMPEGLFLLDSPLTHNNASLTIVGAGQASSVLLVTHKGTALTVNCNSNSQSVTFSDFGMSPIPNGGGAAGTALELNFPAQQAGWCHCSIHDIDLGVARPNYTVFMGGIAFTNVWRANLRNINSHSNIGNVPGSFFIALNGECIDNKFYSCSMDGVDVGVLVNSYCEGLHIIDAVLIGNTGLSTGTTSYSGNGSTTPLINLLGLYISGSEFNCVVQALNLFQVNSGFINDTHFGSQNANLPVVSLEGCWDVQMSSCQVSGALNGNAPADFVGIQTSGSNGGSWCSTANMFDDITFTNVLTGLQYAPGSTSNTATGLRMLAYGAGQLVGPPVSLNGAMMSAVIDRSGNVTNQAQWLSPVDAINGATKRFLYSQP